MARSFCMEFADGSGLSEWPIDDSWQLPAAVRGDATADPNLPSSLLVLLIGVALVVGASVMAFRRGT